MRPRCLCGCDDPPRFERASVRGFVRDAVGHVPGRHVIARRGDVVLGVVEEDVGTERIEERALRTATEEQRLVQPDAPLAQRQDDAFVRGRRARGDQRRADRRRLARRKCLLQAMERIEEAAEGSAGQRLTGTDALVLGECRKTAFAREALGFVAEDHRIAVERDTKLLAGAWRRSGRKNRCGGHARLQRTADIFSIG